MYNQEPCLKCHAQIQYNEYKDDTVICLKCGARYKIVWNESYDEETADTYLLTYLKPVKSD
jgi:DNA-directed RNA polymerase subunit RPC12/RpoP